MRLLSLINLKHDARPLDVMEPLMSEPHAPQDGVIDHHEDDLPSAAGPPKIDWVKTLLIVSATLITVVVMGVGACMMALKNGLH